MRAAILAYHAQKRFKSLLVTSASHGEGRTSVVLNLGIAAAQSGMQVILVDADFVNPALDRELGLQPTPGLTDACVEPLSLAQVVQDTDIRGLRAVTSGNQVSSGPDLAGAPAMEKILSDLTREADLVVLDSSPVLGYGSTLQLAPLAEEVVLVARARGNITPVRRALKLLKDVGREVRGVVINDILAHDLQA